MIQSVTPFAPPDQQVFADPFNAGAPAVDNPATGWAFKNTFGDPRPYRVAMTGQGMAGLGGRPAGLVDAERARERAVGMSGLGQRPAGLVDSELAYAGRLLPPRARRVSRGRVGVRGLGTAFYKQDWAKKLGIVALGTVPYVGPVLAIGAAAYYGAEQQKKAKAAYAEAQASLTKEERSRNIAQIDATVNARANAIYAAKEKSAGNAMSACPVSGLGCKQMRGLGVSMPPADTGSSFDLASFLTNFNSIVGTGVQTYQALKPAPKLPAPAPLAPQPAAPAPAAVPPGGGGSALLPLLLGGGALLLLARR